METIIYVLLVVVGILWIKIVNDKQKAKKLINPNAITPLKKEYNQKLYGVLKNLDEQYTLLNDIYEEGDKLYESIPESIQDTDKWSDVKCCNNYLHCALCDISDAKDYIKKAMV